MPLFYQLWAESSDFYLARALSLTANGHVIAGIEAFEQTLEEAGTLLGNLEIESELRPIDELVALATPENPSTERYGA